MPVQKPKRRPWVKPTISRTPIVRGWRQPADVKRLTITNRWIDGLGFGDIHIGRLHFSDDSSKRVAVKKFHIPLSDHSARQYQETIERLRANGVPLPKMGMIKWEGTWYQVSQLFGSTVKLSKISPGGLEPLFRSPKGREELAAIVAGTINAGCRPTSDFLNSFLRGSLFPIDLDSVIPDKYMRTELTPEQLKDTLEKTLYTAMVRLPEKLKIETLDRIYEKVKDRRFKDVVQKFKFSLFGFET